MYRTLKLWFIESNKTCESCGEPFGCGAKLEGCWCVDVEMAPAIADDLKAKYQDCLCPKCLGSLAPQMSIIDPRNIEKKI